jgi:predicted amidohydrolase
MLEEKIFSIKEKTEIVILPEMFSTGFSMKPALLAEPMEGPTISWMKKIAAAKRIILTGSIIIEENGHYFNRLVWMLPTGEYGIYDKRHRFAFAGENEQYSSGHKRLIASVKGWKINLLVCYDLRFPVWSRQTPASPEEREANADAEYDLLIYVANWPERRNHAWKTLLQARAIENQCFVIGLNRVGEDGNKIKYSGDSMVVDPLGQILYQKSHEEEVFTIALQQNQLQEIRNKFPFLKDADDFTVFAD